MVDLARIRKKAREQKEKLARAASQRASIDLEAPVARLERYKERLLQAAASREEQEAASEESLPQVELLTMLVGNETYALAVNDVEEIVELRSITPVPNAPPPVAGIVSVRGTIVAILDVRERLGASPPQPDADPRLVIVKDRGGLAGFAVDRVSRVLKCDPAELEPAPSLGSEESPGALRGMVRRGDQVISLIDLEKLLA